MKESAPEIPWRDMAALRDRVIHGYFRIDYSIVWDVIRNDLPAVEPAIRALLRQREKLSGVDQS